MKKSLIFTLISLQMIQSPASQAQFVQKLDENWEQSKCFNKLSNFGAFTPSDYIDLQNLSVEMINSETGDTEEVKEVYRKNNCNPDVVNSNNKQLLQKEFKYLKSEDDYKKACEVEQTLNDSEGCQEIRKLHHAIQEGKFTPQDYHALNATKTAQYSNALQLSAVVAIQIVISVYQAYLSKQANDLEKQKYEESKKTTEQVNQPCKANNEEQRKSEAKEENKQESKQDQPEKTNDSQSQTVKQTSIDNSKTIPDVVTPEYPVVDRDPDSDKSWSQFNRAVQKENQLCDQKKKANETGVSLFEIQNPQITHTNPTKTKGEGCNISKLKSDLLFLKSKDLVCSDMNINCTKKQNKNKEKRRLEQKKLKESYRKCELSMGGSTPSEKQECRLLQKQLVGTTGFNQEIHEELGDILNQTKPKSIFTPRPIISQPQGDKK